MADTVTPGLDETSLETERSILGAALRFEDAYTDAAAILSANDFARLAHQLIFAAMGRLRGLGRPIDLTTVKLELSSRDLDEVGGPAYISALVDGMPKLANVAHYARAVKLRASARAVVIHAERAIEEFSRDPEALGNGAGTAYARAVQLLVDAAHTTRVGADSSSVAVGYTVAELAKHVFPPRRVLLTRNGQPLLREGHLAQIYAERGIGKTWFTLSLGLAIASGVDVLGFGAPAPARVTVFDGEMAGEDTQARIVELCERLNIRHRDASMTIVAADWQQAYLPRLDTSDGQRFVQPHVDNADLVILDNRSCLFDPEGEKDAAAWQTAQDFLLSLRRRGKAVIVVHHSNRQGGARGHSKAEDPMDLLIKLARPEGYSAEEGARFLVTFEKARGVHGAAVAPFEARLSEDGWCVSGIEPANSSAAVSRKLIDYVRLAGDNGEAPRSGNRAISGARVNRSAGQKAWAELVKQGIVSERPGGGFHVA